MKVRKLFSEWKQEAVKLELGALEVEKEEKDGYVA